MKKTRFFLLLATLPIVAGNLLGQSYVPVAFIVSDFTTNKNISGAQVSIRQAGWATHSTDTNGKVSFDNVPVGAINYIITKEGYQLYEGEANISSEIKNNTFRPALTPIPTAKDKILVTGEVTDKDGRDIEGAWVEVKAANIIKEGLTDHSGNYSIEIGLNTGYTVNNLAIEVKKGDCKVKQSVDIPRGNVVSKDVKLDCDGEPNKGGSQTNGNQATASKKTSYLGTQTIDDIKLVVTKFEQIGSIATFYFTLENLSETNTARGWSANPGYSALIDQKGNAYTARKQVIGNSEEGLNLIYQNPVECRIEFSVGAVQVTKAAQLVIAAWYDPGRFEFINIPVK